MKQAHKTCELRCERSFKPAYPTQPEKAEISIEEADDLYREIRIENHNWQAMKPPTSHPRKTVLIVDDNPWIRMVFRERFQREADLAVCGEAENGKEAIEKAQQLRPDLIVMDLSMPGMNGLEAARILKRLMPSVPLIMYGAFADESVEQQARLVGIRELVAKSQDPAVLISKARSLLTPRAA